MVDSSGRNQSDEGKPQLTVRGELLTGLNREEGELLEKQPTHHEWCDMRMSKASKLSLKAQRHVRKTVHGFH